MGYALNDSYSHAAAISDGRAFMDILVQAELLRPGPSRSWGLGIRDRRTFSAGRGRAGVDAGRQTLARGYAEHWRVNQAVVRAGLRASEVQDTDAGDVAGWRRLGRSAGRG